MSEEPKEIVIGQERVSDVERSQYSKMISSARGAVDAAKGNEPVGSVPKRPMPLLRKEVKAAEFDPETMGQPQSVAPRPPGSPILSPQTEARLEEMTKAQKAATPAEVSPAVPEAPKEAQEDAIEGLFDFYGKNEAERVFRNKKRRAAIEGRCEPMKVTDLLENDEVTQRVPIIEGEYEVVFKSVLEDDLIWLKKFVAKSYPNESDSYRAEMYGVSQLALSLVAINSKKFPEYRNKDGDVDEAAFKTKLRMLRIKSAYVIADLGVNYEWFDIRVRKLLNPDDLGNG